MYVFFTMFMIKIEKCKLKEIFHVTELTVKTMYLVYFEAIVLRDDVLY